MIDVTRTKAWIGLAVIAVTTGTLAYSMQSQSPAQDVVGTVFQDLIAIVVFGTSMLAAIASLLLAVWPKPRLRYASLVSLLLLAMCAAIFVVTDGLRSMPSFKPVPAAPLPPPT